MKTMGVDTLLTTLLIAFSFGIVFSLCQRRQFLDRPSAMVELKHCGSASCPAAAAASFVSIWLW